MARFNRSCDRFVQRLEWRGCPGSAAACLCNVQSHVPPQLTSIQVLPSLDGSEMSSASASELLSATPLHSPSLVLPPLYSTPYATVPLLPLHPLPRHRVVAVKPFLLLRSPLLSLFSRASRSRSSSCASLSYARHSHSRSAVTSGNGFESRKIRRVYHV